MKMFVGVSVRNDTDGIADGEIVIDFLTFLELARVSDNVAEI